MATLRKKQMMVGQLAKLLNENLDFAAESMINTMPRDKVLKKSADQILKISNKIADLKTVCEMDDEEIKKIMVTIFEEWDKNSVEKFIKEFFDEE